MCSFLLYQLQLDYKPLWEGGRVHSIKLCPLPCMSPETAGIKCHKMNNTAPLPNSYTLWCQVFWQQVEKVEEGYQLIDSI